MNWLSILALAVAPFQGLGGDPSKDFVLVGEKAYGMILPVKACGSGVSSATWSPDGTYVLLERQELTASPDQIKQMVLQAAAGGPKGPPQMETTLTVWNRKTGKSVDVLKRTGSVQVHQSRWLQGTSLGLVLLAEAPMSADPAVVAAGIKSSVIEVDARTGTTKVLASTVGDTDSLSFNVSPSLPLAALFTQHGVGSDTGSTPRSTVQFYRPGVGFSRPIETPKSAFPLGWTKDGRGLHYVQMGKREEGDKTPRTQKHLRLDPGSGELSEMADSTPFGMEQPNYQRVEDLMLQPRFWQGAARQQNLQPVYLVEGMDDPLPSRDDLINRAGQRSGPKPNGALITAEAEYAELCPTKDGVLYITRGVAMYRPIIEVPKELYLQAKAAAERAQAMSQAKQVALGLIMYSADHDDNLPSNAGNWQGDIAPYLKNDSLFGGFNYTFPGGDVTKIERPAETELGYISVPGGRAVAYCDGHVKYIPDK